MDREDLTKAKKYKTRKEWIKNIIQKIKNLNLHQLKNYRIFAPKKEKTKWTKKKGIRLLKILKE